MVSIWNCAACRRIRQRVRCGQLHIQRILRRNDYPERKFVLRKKDNYETLEKTYSIHFNKLDIIYCCGLFVIAVAMSELFYRQSIKYAGRYLSDMRHYIGSKDNAPDMDPIRGVRIILGGLYGINHSTWEDALFMTALVIFTIIMNYIIIRYFITKVCYSRWVYQIASLVALFTGPIAVPGIWWHFYTGTFSKYAWHSPTQIMMVAFALLATWLFFKTYDNYYEKIRVRDWILIALSFVVSAWAKPSFIMIFFPVMAVLLVLDFFLRRDADIKKRFFAALGLGTTAFPACVYFLMLKDSIYNDGGSDSVTTTIGGLADTLTGEIIFGCIFGMAFPIFVLLFNIKGLKDIKYSFLWLVFLVSYVEGRIFGETGIREGHGNFGWGRKMGVYLVFIISIAKFLENFKDPEFMNEKQGLRKFYFIGGSVLLAMHFVCTMYYMANLFMGYKYGI